MLLEWRKRRDTSLKYSKGGSSKAARREIKRRAKRS